ncbi:MAG: DUF2080 family transposase-associated protein [Candidatus Nanoarchaeia archaeon]
MGIVIETANLEIIEKNATIFGTGAHIIISKDYVGKNAKIIAGKTTAKTGKIMLGLFNSEILQRTAARFGTGAHLIVPKEYANFKLKILFNK